MKPRQMIQHTTLCATLYLSFTLFPLNFILPTKRAEKHKVEVSMKEEDFWKTDFEKTEVPAIKNQLIIPSNLSPCPWPRHSGETAIAATSPHFSS